ncbi:MAG: mechanosensitive ion channel [Phycisphaerae bacterium]|nr:mechanosensitive ion channel [Phycisphaerae bacterium]
MNSRSLLRVFVGRRREAQRLMVWVLMWAGVFAAAAQAQSPAAGGADAPAPKAAASASREVKAPQWTLEQVQNRRRQVSDSETIEAEAKATLLEIYDRALAKLRLQEEYRAQRAVYAKERDAAPGDLERLSAQLSEPTAEAKVEIPPDATVADMEQMIAGAEAAHQELVKQAAALDDEPARRLERRARIPEEAVLLKDQLAQVRARLAGAESEGTPEVVQANRMLLEIQAETLDAQIAMLEGEQRYYSATTGLLTARRDMAGRLVTEAQARLRMLRDKFLEARKVQAEKLKADAAAAAKEAMYSHPVVKSLAEENARLAGLATKVVEETESARQYGRGIQAELQRVERDFKEVTEQAEGAGGVTPVMGILLLTRRSGLPDLGPNKQRLRSREGRAADAQFTYTTYEKQWGALNDVQTAAGQILRQAGLQEEAQGYAAVHAEIVKLLGQQREIVRKIADDYRVYSGLLARNDRMERQFIAVAGAYKQFIDERILWVRSSPAMQAADAAALGEAVKWSLSGTNWKGALEAFRGDVMKHPAAYGLLVAVLLGLLYERRRMIGVMGHLTKRVGTKYSDSFVHTWKTLGLTVVLAAPLAGVLLVLSWRLESAAGGVFSDAIASGLWACGWVVAAFRLLMFICYPGGLGQQLGFDPEVLAALRRHFKWFFPLLIPLTFFATIYMSQGMDTAERNSMGRLLFVSELAILAVFLAKVLHPQGAIMGRYLEARISGPVYQFRYMWYGGAVAVPVVLAGLALFGYLYGAQHLYTRLMGTILFVGAVVFLNAFFRRWLTVAQKRIAIRRKREHLAARAESEEAGRGEGAEKTAAPVLSEEAHQEQVGTSSRQAMRLIQVANVLVLAVGLWYLWRDVLPALEALRAVAVWTAQDGTGVVTMAGLIKAAVVIVLTVIVARNLPGLVEMVILQRLPFEAGSRFAITTLCRYTIVVTGVILTFGELGVGWAKVQWLVAAMTVGLGFGLQEIFANFVSGLILLFEQPIRVGDMVTIGDVSGKVTQIRIRATTVRKYDQKELIVPNKEFITGRLINWSLSDKLLRIDFRVGVAYGSDIVKVEATLYRIAQEHPLVLHDQLVPAVVFRGFGDSALDFELRVYVPNMDNYLKVWHEINCAIDTEFRKAGVEIAFPQRDLHIRSGTLGVRMEKPEPETQAEAK